MLLKTSIDSIKSMLITEVSEERLFFRAAPSVRAAVELQALLRGEGLEEIKQGERMDLAGCRMYE